MVLKCFFAEVIYGWSLIIKFWPQNLALLLEVTLSQSRRRVSVRRDWKTNRSSPPPIFDDVLEGEMSTFAKSPMLSPSLLLSRVFPSAVLSRSRTISVRIHETESISETSKAPQRDVGFSYKLG